MSSDPSRDAPTAHSQPAISSGAWSLPGDPPDTPEERYELRNVLGQGGMGRVWIAWDAHLKREVALKELRPDTALDPARLRQEAALTAQLEHPGIVPVYDIGELPDGRPYYTMRLVRGRTLADRLREEGLDDRGALLRVMLSVCQAVATAHRGGVLHRDLKPDNVMLGHAGEVQVVDWGLAASVERAEQSRGPVGTPRWMSPEQAAGRPATPSSDVYSLGAMLFAVILGDAPEPEHRVRLAAAAPPALGAIVQRALAVDPADRYADAGALSEDLARYLDGRLVDAHTYSLCELVQRAAWQARIPLAALLLVGLIGVFAATIAFVQIAAERDVAVQAREEADAARQTAEAHLATAYVQQAARAALDQERDAAESLARRALALRDDPAAKGILAGFSHATRPILLTDAEAPECESWALSRSGELLACSDAERTQVHRLSDGAVLWTRNVRAARLLFAFDDRRLEVWKSNYQGELFDSADGSLVRSGWKHAESKWRVSRTIPHAMAVGSMADFPTVRQPCYLRFVVADAPAERLASVCDGGRVYVGPPEDPLALDVQTDLVGRVHVSAASFSASGEWLALGTLRGGVAAMDLETGDVTYTTLDRSRGIVRQVAMSPDDRLIAAARDTGGIAVWNRETGAWLAEIDAPPGTALAFDALGVLLVAHDRIQRWDLSKLGPSNIVVAETGVADVTVDVDGRHAYIGLSTGAIERLDVRTGRQERVLPAGEDVVKAMVPRPGGGVLLSRLRPNQVLEVERDGGTRIVDEHETFRRLVRLHDGRLLGAGIASRLFEKRPGEAFVKAVDTGLISDLEASPDGRHVVVVEDGRTLRHWSADRGWTERELVPLGDSADVRADGLIARTSPEGIRLESAEGELLAILPMEERSLDVRFSQDGSRLAASSHDGPILVWDVETRQRLASLIGHRERVDTLAFSPDGTWMVSGGWDHQVRIWDLTHL